MNGTWGGISAPTCASWLAMARSALERRSSTIVYYDEAPACHSIPAYGSAPPPGYLMMVN